MTEQSDKPSVEGLMALVHQYKHDWHHSEEAGEASEKRVRAYAECLAALAGPLEQPQEPTSDKANLAQASGGDASKTALPTDTQLIDMLRDESYDICSFAMPTGGGDADIGWQVRSYHMDAPSIRVEGEAFRDAPREALRAAYQALQYRRAVAGPRAAAACEASAGAVPSDKPAASSAPESSLSVPKEQQ